MQRPNEVKADWTQAKRGECQSCGGIGQRVAVVEGSELCASCVDGEYRQQWKNYAMYLENKLIQNSIALQ